MTHSSPPRRSSEFLCASLLAHVRRRSPHASAPGAHEQNDRCDGATGGLSHDAGGDVLAGSVDPHPRNLASPTTAGARRERAILADLIAAIDPANTPATAAPLLAECRPPPRLRPPSTTE